MTTDLAPRRLYLFLLGITTLPMPKGPLVISAGCYLIQMSDGRNVLIDSGTPPDFSAPGPRPDREQNVLQHLAGLGLTPDDVDMVIATHFDVDHVGYHDAFPGAEFVVQRSHYEQARSGHERYAPGRAHWDHPALRYRLVEGDVELLPGVRLIETSGHAFGHQSVLVRLPNTGPVLLVIDAAMFERFFTVERTGTPADDNLEQLIAGTRKLLDLVDREDVSLVVFGHDGLQWPKLRLSPDYYD